jgi:hypothetical protein
MVTSLMPMSETTRFITSTGHGEPAMMPVRRVDRSVLAKLSSASSAMNIVGTPYRLVQRSWRPRRASPPARRTAPG